MDDCVHSGADSDRPVVRRVGIAETEGAHQNVEGWQTHLQQADRLFRISLFRCDNGNGNLRTAGHRQPHHHGGSRTVAGLRVGDGQHREPRARAAWLCRQVLAHAAGNGISEAKGQHTGRGAGGESEREPEGEQKRKP